MGPIHGNIALFVLEPAVVFAIYKPDSLCRLGLGPRASVQHSGTTAGLATELDRIKQGFGRECWTKVRVLCLR